MREQRIINGPSSLFLDTLRLICALIVFFHHAHDQWFKSSLTLANAAHASVVVFFVLSGYVIAYTTTNNNRGPLLYLQARLSRLCSVVVPALIVTGLIEYVLKQNDSQLYNEYSRGISWPRYLLSLLFLNDIWFLSAAPPINGPLWSLSYEFWYYAIFGLWFYRGESTKSWLLPILACLIAGPKILLMMPVWFMGFCAYVLPKRKFSFRLAWLLIMVGLVTTVVAVHFLPIFPFPIGTQPFYYANQFVTDWGVGFLIALTLGFLPLGSTAVRDSSSLLLFRKVADLTFPIYLLHFPLLVLWRSVFPYQAGNNLQFLQALMGVLFISVLLGLLLERYRSAYSLFFKYLLTSMKTWNRKAILKVPESTLK